MFVVLDLRHATAGSGSSAPSDGTRRMAPRYHRWVTMTAGSAGRSGGVSDSTWDGPADLDSLAAASSLFRSLGDPSRLAILGHLALGEHKVRELTNHLGLAQSTVSAHLRCLLDCQLVEVRAVGRSSVYSLAVEAEVLAVLGAAEQLLAATGDAVVLCPRYGPDAAR